MAEFLTQVFAASFNILSIIMLVVGAILVVIEMFTPGLGAPGITGSILLVIGIVIAARSPAQALFLGIITLLVLLLAFAIMLVLASTGKLDRSALVLRSKPEKSEGFLPGETLQELLGCEGEALTTLRPAGIGRFGNRRVDVLTKGDYIDAGTRIKVVETAGNAVAVEPVEREQAVG